MKRIDTWVTRNLDPTEQGIIARDGLDVCAVTWNLINNSQLVCKTYADHAAHIWMMLDAKAEQYSSRPPRSSTIAARKRRLALQPWFAEVALLWAIEEVCKENRPDWVESRMMAAMQNRLMDAAEKHNHRAIQLFRPATQATIARQRANDHIITVRLPKIERRPPARAGSLLAPTPSLVGHGGPRLA